MGRLHYDQTLWTTPDFYSICIAYRRFKDLKTDNNTPLPQCLHAHLPPRLIVFIVADTPGISKQWAGEGRQLSSFWTQDDVAACPGARVIAIDNHVMGAFGRRLLWSWTFWRGQKCDRVRYRRGHWAAMRTDGINVDATCNKIKSWNSPPALSGNSIYFHILVLSPTMAMNFNQKRSLFLFSLPLKCDSPCRRIKKTTRDGGVSG